jgi:uncharacterized protein
MNLMKKIFLFLLFLFSIQLSAQNQTEIPELKRPVMDLVGILKPEEVSIIENKILNLQKEKGSQIAVLIIPSTGDLPIEDYSIRVAEKWKLGRKGVDDGVLFLIAYNDRKMRIEVGYGLEGAIPDGKAKQILDDFVRPHFKNKNFYKGIDTGVDLLIKLIKNEPLPEPQQDQVTPFIVGLIFMFVPLIFHSIAIFLIFINSRILGVIIAILDLALIITLSNYIPIWLSVFLSVFPIWFLISLILIIFRFLKKGNYQTIQGTRWTSSSTNWSSSRAGGFSGGGGSFGGGGSSSSW